MFWTELVKPAVRRLGTGLGGYLVGLGVQENLSTQIATGAVALALVGIDLWQSHRERK